MYRIVIADDVEQQRTIARKILLDLGHDVVGEAADGEELLDLVKQLHPDMILVDVAMPRMGGDVAVLSLAAPLPRIILATNVLHYAIKGIATRVGAKFCTKPYVPERLREVINSFQDEPEAVSA